jgi:hypothetical protein
MNFKKSYYKVKVLTSTCYWDHQDWQSACRNVQKCFLQCFLQRPRTTTDVKFIRGSSVWLVSVQRTRSVDRGSTRAARGDRVSVATSI